MATWKATTISSEWYVNRYEEAAKALGAATERRVGPEGIVEVYAPDLPEMYAPAIRELLGEGVRAAEMTHELVAARAAMLVADRP